ncbi:N-acetyltransferase [Deinococcus psychrotolerans]|uniref:N-acetyltransferase n=1 Tax=Deinococcus psychrotolerans TaxID=2489213 RepID=A0A3G8YLZ4_9DEIO|nr:GNAT family protein [Deinococcus psychrotolerans]AZI42651.1 N-acetyltransferase [Deinococcus psychrotolerans]
MRHDLTLSNGFYTLRPLQDSDVEPLMRLAAQAPHEYAQMGTSPVLRAYFTAALEAPDQLPFVSLVSGECAGSTRYMEMRPEHKRLEIGSTWLAPAYLRSGANRALKLLQLTHAFEVMKMRRVEIKTDAVNVRSQTAIAALGAVREGVMRKHMVRTDGSERDTVMFSVTDEEWPEMKARLERRR